MQPNLPKTINRTYLVTFLSIKIIHFIKKLKWTGRFWFKIHFICRKFLKKFCSIGKAIEKILDRYSLFCSKIFEWSNFDVFKQKYQNSILEIFLKLWHLVAHWTLSSDSISSKTTHFRNYLKFRKICENVISNEYGKLRKLTF